MYKTFRPANPKYRIRWYQRVLFRLGLVLALAVVLAVSLASGASAHATHRRVWVRNEWGQRVLVCEQYGRVHYGRGGYAWYPVPCK